MPATRVEAVYAENEYVRLKFYNGVIYGKYLVRALNMPVVNSVMQLQHNTFGKNTPLILVDISNIKSVTKEVRDHFSNPEVLGNVRAAAYIAPSFIHKLLLTFFLNFNKPSVPMAFFTTEADALRWLDKFR